MRKIAQTKIDELVQQLPQLVGGKKHGRGERLVPQAFPDYGRSLVSQRKSSPTMAGILRALGYGAGGAAIGAGAGKIGGLDNRETLLAGLLSGLITGAIGFQSGRRDQESENTKLLFLRRLGIDSPGELEAMEDYPAMAYRITAKGEKI